MDELKQLLDEADVTPNQRQRIRELFGLGDDNAFSIRPIAIEPTIHDSLDLSKRTVLYSEDSVSLEGEVPNQRQGEKVGRYIDLGMLGRGGMGEVRRILDPGLNRRLAMKIIHAKFLEMDAAVSRFVEEAQVVAQLQHPNIIPIHEIGALEDGRLYFTMKEVKGQPLSEIIAEVHGAAVDATWTTSRNGWTFRKLIGIFTDVCAASAFAHERGVVHRDLKPENVLVGAFDQVLVVDWGIAKVVGRMQQDIDSDDRVQTGRGSANETRMGAVAGTPAYMAPEQARGLIDKIDQRTDVYALGAILYEILSGRSPYGGASFDQVLSKVIMGPPPSVRQTVIDDGRQTETIELDFFDFDSIMEDEVESAPLEDRNEQGLKLPDELVAICERAMQRHPDARYPNVSMMLRDVLDWIEGANKKDKALSVVSEALANDSQRESLTQKSKALLEESEQLREPLPPWASQDELKPAWEKEDKSTQLALEEHLLHIQRLQMLRASLTHKSDLPEAHAELALDYQQKHVVAEAQGDLARAEKALLSLEAHLEKLSEDHPTHVALTNYLNGEGLLSLQTNPPGAKVFAARYETQNRRLVLGDEILLGESPIESKPMKMGSYLLTIRHEGCQDVRYPVRIDRQGHWSGEDPDGDAPPIWLPPLGYLGDHDCYVPAGPFLCGRSPSSTSPLPNAKVWTDAFIVRRFPVTYAEYRDYLQDLLDNGLSDDLQAAMPIEQSQGSGSSGASTFEITEDKRAVIGNDLKGFPAQADWPVCYINFKQAVAYVEWYAEKTGQPWRLLTEFELEKTARGVDARIYPWGDFFSALWCSMEMSKPEKTPTSIHAFPVDESVYGVRGCAGSMPSWSCTPWELNVPLEPYARAEVTPPYPSDTELRTWRGGAWNFPVMMCTAANRIAFHETEGTGHLGLRIGRSITEK